MAKTRATARKQVMLLVLSSILLMQQRYGCEVHAWTSTSPSSLPTARRAVTAASSPLFSKKTTLSNGTRRKTEERSVWSLDALSKSHCSSETRGLFSFSRRMGVMWNKQRPVSKASIRLKLFKTSILRRSAGMLVAAFFWLAASCFSTQPAVAAVHSSSNSPVTHVIERVKPTSSLSATTTLLASSSSVSSADSSSMDNIVDRYVRKYMFADDEYDEIESTYREAVDDATTGRYPAALRDVSMSVTGQGAVQQDTDGVSSTNGLGVLLTKAVATLQKRLGVSQQLAVTILAAAFVVSGPSLFLVGGMVIGGFSKRSINKVMKDRYGDTYTVDATVKEPEDVEAPDDDDDFDDDDDDEDDDDDDE